MRRTGWTAVAAAALVCSACGGSSSGDNTGASSNDPSSRPGSAAVYARIESGTDCVALQREFDVAMDNVDSRQPGDEMRAVSESYAAAANNRMREIGCYG